MARYPAGFHWREELINVVSKHPSSCCVEDRLPGCKNVNRDFSPIFLTLSVMQYRRIKTFSPRSVIQMPLCYTEDSVKRKHLELQETQFENQFGNIRH